MHHNSDKWLLFSVRDLYTCIYVYHTHVMICITYWQYIVLCSSWKENRLQKRKQKYIAQTSSTYKASLSTVFMPFPGFTLIITKCKLIAFRRMLLVYQHFILNVLVVLYSFSDSLQPAPAELWPVIMKNTSWKFW